MMKEIKTYKDLCKEIERIKKSIEEVKKGLGYEQGDELERLNKELIKAITKSILPKKYEDIDKKHKPWKYVNTNCD